MAGGYEIRAKGVVGPRGGPHRAREALIRVITRRNLGLIPHRGYGVENFEIVGKIRALAQTRQHRLGEDVLTELRGLAPGPDRGQTGAAEEHARFLAIAEPGLYLPEAELADRL